MKKLTALILAVILVLSLSTSAFAETPTTTVTYVGTAAESYSITVPVTMAPGASGTVSLTGQWAANRTVTVTAPTEVVLTNSIDSSTKTLAITFAGITKDGSNTEAISTSGSLAVQEITAALFGTWTGTVTYTASIADKV